MCCVQNSPPPCPGFSLIRNVVLLLSQFHGLANVPVVMKVLLLLKKGLLPPFLTSAGRSAKGKVAIPLVHVTRV